MDAGGLSGDRAGGYDEKPAETRSMSAAMRPVDKTEVSQFDSEPDGLNPDHGGSFFVRGMEN
jgi:hypothetical protein